MAEKIGRVTRFPDSGWTNGVVFVRKIQWTIVFVAGHSVSKLKWLTFNIAGETIQTPLFSTEPKSSFIATPSCLAEDTIPPTTLLTGRHAL